MMIMKGFIFSVNREQELSLLFTPELVSCGTEDYMSEQISETHKWFKSKPHKLAPGVYKADLEFDSYRSYEGEYDEHIDFINIEPVFLLEETKPICVNHTDGSCRKDSEEQDRIYEENYKKQQAYITPQPIDKWHEDMGCKLWWQFPVEEPPYTGSPLFDDFPDYVTHYTDIPMPELKTKKEYDFITWS